MRLVTYSSRGEDGFMLWGMTRPVLAAALWFVALAYASEVAWSIFDTPRFLGIVAAATVALLVYAKLPRQGVVKVRAASQPVRTSSVAPSRG